MRDRFFKRPASKPAPMRRGALRRNVALPDRRASLTRTIHHPAFMPDMIIALCFVLLMTVLLTLTHDALVVTSGRVMTDTRAVRVDFQVPDEQRTEAERALERDRAPWIFDADVSYLESLRQELHSLPATLAEVDSIDSVSGEIRDRFKLTQEQFDALRSTASDATQLQRWKSRIDRLIRRLFEREPLLRSAEFQNVRTQSQENVIILRKGVRGDAPAEPHTTTKESAINVNSPDLASTLTNIANDMELYGPLEALVVQRLLHERRPTHFYNREATEESREARAESVPLQMTTHSAGDLIYREGRRLNDGALQLARLERNAYLNSLGFGDHAARVAEAAVAIALLASTLGGYLWFYYPRVLVRPWRLGALAALLAGACAGGCWLAIANPGLMWFGVAGPAALIAMIAAIAYDRRLAFAMGAAVALVITLALELNVAALAVCLAAAAAAAWQFADIRDRRDMIFGAMLTGVVCLFSVVVMTLLTAGSGEGILIDALAQGVQAGLSGFLAGVVTLVILPYVERVFDITTGMTLTELRDSRQPLLRELQQRAPGTYSHSLNVAALAEAAAEAIGADSRQTYVGALYHDIGKMNKPDYFVENQVKGHNRHSKLSPAMSLLVIVGHVKDGMELAREYGLPRSLHHYIESHHGSTLVEYFFDQAKRQADADDNVDAPAEIEYRYPGPRPRTREAAILMLCDAVESATRAMADPTPARISALVTDMARKRLLDGQFDESSLTLKEIKTIEEVVTKSLCSMYHGRIAYPREEKRKTTIRGAEDRAEAAG